MIFVTGDIHGDIDIGKLNTRNFPEQKTMTKNDYVIICGDFGVVWYPHDHPKHRSDMYWLKWLRKKNFTTLFVDGNHENFPLLYSYPVVDFKGGKAHKICDGVYHLMRGEVYNIEGKSFFCFGGARSHDMDSRVEGVSWWREEIPNMKEMEHGIERMKKVGNYVDYVITHCCAGYIQDSIAPWYDKDSVTSYFDFMEDIIDFGHWFFGHYHMNKEIDEKHTCLYDEIIRIQ